MFVSVGGSQCEPAQESGQREGTVGNGKSNVQESDVNYHW